MAGKKLLNRVMNHRFLSRIYKRSVHFRLCQRGRSKWATPSSTCSANPARTTQSHSRSSKANSAPMLPARKAVSWLLLLFLLTLQFGWRFLDGALPLWMIPVSFSTPSSPHEPVKKILIDSEMTEVTIDNVSRDG